MKKTSLYHSRPKFLLDENVRIELFHFLSGEGYDIRISPKGITDQKVAFICKKEHLVLVTNDSDFTDPELYSRDELFAVVWLRIPQFDDNKLIHSFNKLLTEYKKDYEGKLFLLVDNSWEVYNLWIAIELRN